MSRDIAREVLRVEAEAIARLIERVDDRFEAAVELVLKNRGRVIVSGLGKSGLIARKIAATLSSVGSPAYFLHPTEAVHGDLGVLVEGDLVIVLSSSGETAEILRLLEFVRRLSLPIVAFVGNRESTLARQADVAIDVGIEREACPLGLAPTASTTVALAMGDALAMTVADRRGFTVEDFARRHPGGRLGFQLVQVKDLMRTGDAVPRTGEQQSMRDAIREMTRKGVGMTCVVDAAGRLVGVITDGDLRRLLEQGGALEAKLAGGCCTRLPKTIQGSEPASRALACLEEHEITSLVVVDAEGRPSGLVHLHDLWRVGLF